MRMSEFREIRQALGDLRERVTMLETQMLHAYQDDLRAGFARVNADLAQVTELLTSERDTRRPARRPENTQSASDSPLT